MSAEVWGVVAAFAGVGAAFLAVFVAALFWVVTAIQRSSAEIRGEIRAEIRDLRVDNQRLFDALYRHRHDAGGMIYVPADDD